MRESVRGPLHI